MVKNKCSTPKCGQKFWTRLKDRDKCRKHEDSPLYRESPRKPRIARKILKSFLESPAVQGGKKRKK
jgi:hypothetical protein